MNKAVRQGKKNFLADLNDSEKRILRDVLDLTPSAFWQAVRFGERYGPNGIQEFVRSSKNAPKATVSISASRAPLARTKPQPIPLELTALPHS